MMPQAERFRQFAAIQPTIRRGRGLRPAAADPTAGCMIPRSPLDDPEVAHYAWTRYWRVLRWMMAATVMMVAGAMIALYHTNGFVSVNLFIAAALGISLTMLLMSALMGLMFLSSGTGHDDAIVDPLEEELDSPDEDPR
jgi:hypothetical protein